MKISHRSGLAALGFAALLMGSTALSAKTLVYCSEGSPENFTPAINTTGTSFDAARARSTTSWSSSSAARTKVMPGLAERWDVSRRRHDITFHLRKGVKFHPTSTSFTPTRDFNADDVSSRSTASGRGHPITRSPAARMTTSTTWTCRSSSRAIDKVDDHTVSLEAQGAERADPRQSGDGLRLDPVRRICRQADEGRQAEQFDQIPVGTGPFHFVAYQKDAVIRFKANPDTGRGKPTIDDLVFAITPDPTARYAKLKAGECHVMPYRARPT